MRADSDRHSCQSRTVGSRPRRQLTHWGMLVGDSGVGAAVKVSPWPTLWRSAGLMHGNCRALEQKSQKVLGPCFSLNCRKYLKTRAHCEGFSTLNPQTGHLGRKSRASGQSINGWETEGGVQGWGGWLGSWGRWVGGLREKA